MARIRYNFSVVDSRFSILQIDTSARPGNPDFGSAPGARESPAWRNMSRSEEHTSELQSLAYLVCRLLLEKKKKKRNKRSVSMLPALSRCHNSYATLLSS